jgi:hypothetical protein
MILKNTISWRFLRNTEINFRAPLQSRRWIKLLKPHPAYDFLIKQNLKLPKRLLGFSFSSNRHGLRGPDNVHANTVFIGTSFTMGFAVNDGENWYDNISDWRSFLNLGLPVGINQLNALQMNIHCGAPNKLILMYHPNFWKLSYRSYLLKQNNKSIFNHWETRLVKCVGLQWKKARTLKRRLAEGKLVKIEHNRRLFFLNPNYACYEFKKNKKFEDCFLNGILVLANRFKQVHLIPVFPKEAYAPCNQRLPELEFTKHNYQIGLNLVVKKLQHMTNFFFHDSDKFSLENFHSWDPHWNKSGNELFFQKLQKILS